MNISVKILICIVFYGCTKSNDDIYSEFLSDTPTIKVISGESKLPNEIEFTEVQTFGNTSENYYKRINKIALDENENVYVENNSSIHQYDSTGKYIQSIGQKGRGPGEFQMIHNFKISNSRLFVYDANLQRISIYNLNSTELEKVISIPVIDGLIGLGEFAVQENGTIVLGLIKSRKNSNNSITEKYMHYFFLDNSGQISKTEIITTRLAGYFEVTNNNGTSYPPIPFDRSTLFSGSPSGKMYFLWTEDIAIKVLNSDGSIHKGIYYPFQNIEVSDNSDYPNVYSKLNIISDTKRILDDRLPATHPAVVHFLIDDDERLWLSTIIEDKEQYEWWILENSGDLITKFKWPRDKPIEYIRGDYLYTKENDEEGADFVVKYRFEFVESK